MIIDSRYKVIEQIGSGVWANIYNVLDMRSDKIFTLKFFLHIDAKNIYEKLSPEEMHHITQLEHPNLVPVVTFGNMGKHIYCVSEQFDGKNLQNFRLKLSKINMFYDMIVQCLYALHTLHSQKIYHKDIKPSNILYKQTDDSIEVKLIDYGFNKLDTEINQQSISGTLPYVAPELFHKFDATTQSDFYSLGVTLYRLITGVLPFSIEQISAIREGNLHNYFPKFIREIKPEIPVGLEKFIMKLLEKNPQDRFHDVQAAISFLNKIQSNSYNFSHRISLLQSVNLDSYIVRSNYTEILIDYVKNMTHGNGKLISIVGGFGLGKQRILTLLKYHFFTNEFFIFDYTCSVNKHDPFFALIKEFMSSIENNENKKHLFSEISADLRNFLETTGEIAISDNQLFVENSDRDKLKEKQNDFHTAATFLDNLSDEKPLLFIIRAAQYLTKETLEFLNFLSSLIYKKPILIILSTNDHSRIAGLIHSVQIKIAPLSLSETKNYIRKLLNTEPNDDFAENILTRSSGNPYFIKEIILDLLDKKSIIKNNQLDFVVDFNRYVLPEHLNRLIFDRINKLDKTNASYLKQLAVVNTPITIKMIGQLLQLNDKEIFHITNNAVNYEIFKVDNENYEFTFIEIKQYFVKKCTKNEIISISKKLLAYFDDKKDIDLYVCQGIIQNAEVIDNFTAIRKYRHKLIDIYSENNDQLKAFNEIYKIIAYELNNYREINEDDFRTDLMLFVDKADLTGLSEEALSLLSEQQLPVFLFEWHYAISNLYLQTEKYEIALRYLDNCKTLINDDSQRLKMELDLAFIYLKQNKNEKVNKILKTLKIDKADSDSLMDYYDLRGLLLVNSGKTEEAILWYEDCLNLIEKPKSTKLGAVYNSLGILYCKEKMYSDAKRMMFLCKAEWERLNYDRLLGIVYTNIADMYLWQGNTKKSIEFLVKAESLYKVTKKYRFLAANQINFAETYIKLGRFNEAENYLNQAKALGKSLNIAEYDSTIAYNMALVKNKTQNFYHFYNFIETEFPDVLNNKIIALNPAIKSYFFYLYEIGDKDKITSILYSDFNLTKTKDQDFYFQVLAMLSILKGNYHTAINNYLVALDYAHKSMSAYTITIIYINLAITYYLNNEVDKAIEYIDKADPLIEENDYQYWRSLANITRIKANMLKKEVPIRKILRDAFNQLNLIKNNHYFLLEIELYGIIVQIYNELNAYKHSQSYYRIYTEKVRDAVRNLPEKEQKNYHHQKQSLLKSITDFSIYNIVGRDKIKPTDWNKEILSLLRLNDVNRIKFFLNLRINKFFSPYTYAIIIFNSGASHTKLNQANYSVYLSNNFDEILLKNDEIVNYANKSIADDKLLQFNFDGKHFLISPIILKQSKIGFWIISDFGEMPFSANEIKIISTFSFHLSTMLIRLSEFEEENQKISLLQDLMSITGNMIQTYNVDQLEHDLVFSIINVTKATRGLLVKRDNLGNYFYSVAIDNENNLIGDVSNFSKNVLGEVSSSRHPIYLENFLKELHSKDSTGNSNDDSQLYSIDNQANSLYCAPIIVDNEIYAVLYLDNYPDKNNNLNIIPEMMNLFLIQVSLAFLNAKTYQSLLAKNMELFALDKMKNHFLKVVSHELNTPLFTLQEYVYKMKKSLNSEDTATNELLTKVDKNFKKLNNTINDILTLNSYNNYNFLIKEKHDISKILSAQYQEALDLSSSRKMKIKLDIMDNLPFAEVDSEAIHILVRNLLFNAIRFTADYGSITLGARMAIFPYEKLDEKETIVIYVQDNGIGIPGRDQKNIFKPFYELGDIYSHRSGELEFRSGGLGVGLSIANRITELHEGKIWAQSKVNEGTIFFVSLPIE